MNNEEILNKYKESLDILCGDISNLDIDELNERKQKIRQMQYSNNIVEKSFSSIAILFNREDALIYYSSACLFYRNNKWYKYNGNNPEEIHLNNAIELSNTELFKLIKRTMYFREKKYILDQFLITNPEYSLNLEQLNINKTHLIEFINLTIDSQIYQEIRIILEHLLTIDEMYIIT
jgi:hypothetical protein